MVFNQIKVSDTTSTNTYLKRLIVSKKANEGTVILTNHQTAGKGQQGNSWESEKNKNLTFSLLLEPPILAENMFLVSKLVSVAIIKALKEFNIETTIKWPNDIYYHNKKISGILIENQLFGNKIKHSIIGIGLNVNQTTFLSHAPNPVSMKNITQKTYDIDDVFSKLLINISELYQQIKTVDFIDQKYHNNLYRKTGFYSYKTELEEFIAKLISVENDGQLILQKENSDTIGFYFKEVEFVL